MIPDSAANHIGLIVPNKKIWCYHANMKWEKFIQSGFRMPFYMNLYVAGKAVGVRAITGWNHSKCLVIIDQQI